MSHEPTNTISFAKHSGDGRSSRPNRPFPNVLSPQGRQWFWYGALFAVSFFMTAILLGNSSHVFERYFGKIHPFIAIGLCGLAGACGVRFLQSRWQFELFNRRSVHRGIRFSAISATLLGVAIVIADTLHPYPEDTNVALPEALLFYPAIGFVAEIIFHVLPLSAVLLIAGPLFRERQRERALWLAITVTAIAEPTFQVMMAREPYSLMSVYFWIHIFAIAFLQLYVYKRHGFVVMYVFRIMYYTYWHIAWGTLRLELLF